MCTSIRRLEDTSLRPKAMKWCPVCQNTKNRSEVARVSWQVSYVDIWRYHTNLQGQQENLEILILTFFFKWEKNSLRRLLSQERNRSGKRLKQVVEHKI